MEQYHLLIVDDEKNIREGLAQFFRMEGYAVTLAEDGAQALTLLNKERYSLVICDLRMPKISGDELLLTTKKSQPFLPFIMLTGHGTVENAVAAMRSGAYNFLTKPVNLEYLLLLVQQAITTQKLQSDQEEVQLFLAKEKLNIRQHFVSGSPAMQRVYQLIEQVAPSKANVLITGESGVGKEMVANAIHALSPRYNQPLIKVHCAALSENLLESELFGHEKGAFTGAHAMRKGRFELADNGDLFLDEIGEISPTVQVKLLRVLQERRFERVGGEVSVEVDVRLITATNRDLLQEVKEERFREDLYYRLNVINIHIPPLRERREDIMPLAGQFLREFSLENQKRIQGFSPQAASLLQEFDWPGNVRQLRNCIESAVVLSDGETIDKEHLPIYVESSLNEVNFCINEELLLEDLERNYMEFMLLRHQGNKSKVAKKLGISRKTLLRKMQLEE
ncbi:sigma-54-dependent transcriptional regulator [Entomospira culicis]|uniref:Sigma-54-dependent Fis family transcriptional regulator n=1 Tax=Entomospira culicis TaxID=2719989 RepID=A0A968KUG5_9SPIO|nr:sigma-54 dependent transcriptional regulator [Entomospira culicis]NIZ19551.1 sigma-54-dependent Fis family transcriptional regulator [Entomospira culicis]NIZ69544.1 sigma-54-dependent Fis family transcriptional regulator [Entomospira culicis]WDI36655.1 sigma-54 dependent transcriptional regulator [Entomospira culicis]WDI38284.1 sigma-54 dependent transcriptional regulator [Entomospira culicis]